MLSLIMLPFFISCEKEEEIPISNSLSTGNIYCSDGSTIHPSNYAESGKKAVGIIYWVNPDENTDPKALAVGLEDLTMAFWADTLISVSNVSTDLSAFDGGSNTASIISWGIEEGRKTPAITNAYNYSILGVVGWFVPSHGEVKYLYSRKKEVEASFTACGGNAFSEWYWTSTQDGSGNDNSKINALAISMKEGNSTVSSKFNSFPVRPVIAIK